MRSIVMNTAIVMLLCCAVAASAQCPNLNGAWSTTDGTMIGGRASEAWCGADGMPIQGGVPGNTQDAMSWNGATLSTQWRAWGMQIDPVGAVLISSNLDGFGNGSVTYRTNYVGGQFWLTGANTWSDGVADLNGNLTSYIVFTTINFFGGVQVGAASNITFTGEFVNCPGANGCFIRFAIANALKVWDTNSIFPMPANYPTFACGASSGEFFDVCCVNVDINCAIEVEKSSWGTVKALFK